MGRLLPCLFRVRSRRWPIGKDRSLATASGTRAVGWCSQRHRLGSSYQPSQRAVAEEEYGGGCSARIEQEIQSVVPVVSYSTSSVQESHGSELHYLSVSYTHLTLPTNREV